MDKKINTPTEIPEALKPIVLPSEESFQRLTTALEQSNPGGMKQLFRSFTNGIATGLGATIGVTVTMSFLGWMLSTLGFFEPLKPLTTALQKVINNTNSMGTKASSLAPQDSPDRRNR